MGIEPTERKVDLRPNGFEDRGHHQVCKHFPKLQYSLRVPRAFPAGANPAAHGDSSSRGIATSI